MKGEPVGTIIISHSHWDHASGISDFPEATVSAPASELEVIRHAGESFGGAWPSQVGSPTIKWKSLEFKPTPHEGFDASLDDPAAVAEITARRASAEMRIAVLEAAVKGYAQDAANFEAFKTAFNAYAEFYRTHMMTEEREVLPLIRKHFTAEDWDRANAGFIADDPFAGTRSPAKDSAEDFAHIFSKLVAAAPAPIGLGAGPYKEG